MRWTELSVEAAPEFVEPLSEIFQRYGHGGVVIEQDADYNPDEGEAAPEPDWVVVKTYLPMDAGMEDRRNQIDLGVRLVAHLGSVSSLRERVLEEEEWANAWKRHFNVLRIGTRVVIVPTWREYEPGGSDVVVLLDPGMAFGTGHHPTTRMCLELLEEVLRPGDSVLDVGCGSGILSIAAAKLGAGSGLALDIDTSAVEAAEANLRQNGVSQSVRVAKGSLPCPAVGATTFDIVIANISGKAISDMAHQLVAATGPGGSLIVSGILAKDHDSVARRLTEAGARTDLSRIDSDWASLVVLRR